MLPSALLLAGGDEYASTATDSGTSTSGAGSPTSTSWKSHEAPSVALLGLSFMPGPHHISGLKPSPSPSHDPKPRRTGCSEGGRYLELHSLTQQAFAVSGIR